MGFYSVGASFLETAATAQSVGADLWNPHASKSLWVVELSYCRSQAAVAVCDIGLKRATTRGTPGSTVTPDVDNALEQDLAPPSGALLDLSTFSVQPTLAGPFFKRLIQFDAAGIGLSWVFPGKGMHVPPGTGLAIYNDSMVTLKAGDVTYTWWEGP